MALAEQIEPAEPLVRVEDLTVRFPGGRAGFWGQTELEVHAIERMSFEIFPGETLGLVGESGSGKTTAGRAVLGRTPVKSGHIYFDGRDITNIEGDARRLLSRDMQLIFQDPYASLNPRMRILDLVAEPLIVHGLVRNRDEAVDEVKELLRKVGLPANAFERFPHAFSGGQRQRVVIARALALKPRFIVADEPVSALDVSIRAQVVNLLQDLQQEFGLTYLFIAHDLSVVQHVSDRIAIMYAGKLFEIGSADAIYSNPKHPYTEALLSAVPVPDPVIQRSQKRIVFEGEPPSPIYPPKGCRFAKRCPLATAQCENEEPPLAEKAPGQFAACWNRN
ncbi:ABC transporter ATP-binding protein [Oceanibium sediminis]|uniref:ABC transporter ATP-binding protein n=1 Tax=Oceanibium sediminis TaxID=2026339 RepID=UPI001E5915FA|nr:ABC transporter ATP-binding protein [Oceanibium sediminis]